MSRDESHAYEFLLLGTVVFSLNKSNFFGMIAELDKKNSPLLILLKILVSWFEF
jgi:hypothetical protein